MSDTQIRVDLERLSNGFLATMDGVRTYYPTLEKLAQSLILEKLKEQDTFFREHDASGETRVLEFKYSRGEE